MDTTERLRKIVHKNKEILVLDYSDLKEGDMIELVSAARALIQQENKPVLVLSIFNRKNYASRKYIRHLEKELRQIEPLIAKNTVTGISEIQRWIVKGINLWYKNQLHPFDSVDKALDFLVS